MTRDEALLKLIAIEPADRAALIATTGWGIDAVNFVVDKLLDAGQLAHWPFSGQKKLCTPAARAAHLEWYAQQRTPRADTSPRRARTHA